MPVYIWFGVLALGLALALEFVGARVAATWVSERLSYLLSGPPFRFRNVEENEKETDQTHNCIQSKASDFSKL